jgi:hypothetical protein
MESDYDTKYPKSKNNFQCLGPCYEKGTFIIHPVTLEYTTDTLHPFCAVNEWEYTNPETGKKEMRINDVCFNPTSKDNISAKELEMNIILPKMDFSCEHFLKIYYDIFSMETAIEWVDSNKHVPYYSVQRIMDCAWKAYGLKSQEYILDDRIIIYYTNLLKSRWFKEVYEYIASYISVDDGKIFFSEGDSDMEKMREIKENFLIEKLINYATVKKFLLKFINYYSKKPLSMSITKLIKVEFKKFIEKKIMSSK